MSRKKIDWEKAKELCREGLSYREIAEELNIGEQTLRNNRLKQMVEEEKENEGVTKQKIKYENKKKKTNDSVREFVKLMKAAQKAQEKLSDKQIEASVKIQEERPIGIALTSDWHIGCGGTDYQKLEEDLELIRDTEGLYVVGLGDYKDNYIRNAPPGGQYQQIIQPGTQDQVVFYYMSIIAEKIIALIRGCHDHWDARHGDRDFISALCSEFDCVNLWHGGALRIKLGNQEYLFRLRHKYKYQSSLNLENAMRRLMEIQGPCDVAAEAHFHNPYVMTREIAGKMRVLARSGSYKVWDDYGQQLAGYKGTPGVPVIIIWPDQHKVLALPDLREGIEVLNYYRNKEES